eukprot:Skav232632  [mRNA]  locus=scaffold12:192714:192974:+ [translate_table: standard]
MIGFSMGFFRQSISGMTWMNSSLHDDFLTVTEVKLTAGLVLLNLLDEMEELGHYRGNWKVVTWPTGAAASSPDSMGPPSFATEMAP